MASKTKRTSRRSRQSAHEPAEKRWLVQTAHEHVLSQHDKRLDAEMAAARKSKNGGWVEVRDRAAPLRYTDEQRRQMPVLGAHSFAWVSIYRNGWLKDSNRRGSYVPADQKKYWASLR